ncbi:MAG TPA: hypothetical protein DEA05_11895 [Rhodobacteraceae bacterium]|nr:hypothetical protein [Paracoccaceae bacterium]
MNRLITLCFPLVLAACAGPVDMYYKPGGSVSRLASDTTDCQVRALRDAPVANQVRQRPPVYVPGNRWCNAAGQCYTAPGYWVDGGVYSVDVNAGLRGRVEAQCMAARGYAPVSLPRCSPQVADAAPRQVTTRLPRIGPGSCIIPYEAGGFQIVTPG